MSSIILKTLRDKKDPAKGSPMLQDTHRGVIYTSRRPHLTEMNPFVESFVNSSSTGTQGGPSTRRPKQLLILVNSDECSRLNDDVTDADLAADWKKYTDGLRKDAGDKAAGNKAVDSLTDEQWAAWCKEWVKTNSGAKKAKAVEEEQEEGTGEAGGETGEAETNTGGRRNKRG